MNELRIRIRPAGPWITPWHADTLFGHLCWLLALTEGEDALRLWLDDMASPQPPLILSDGFPAERLPTPLLAGPQPVAGTLKDQVEAFRAARDAGRGWLDRAAFEQVLAGEVATRQQDDPSVADIAVKNAIDRRTGSTLDEGGLYALAARSLPPGGEIIVYARVAPAEEQLVRDLFAALGTWGWGKRASAGYGAIASVDVEAWAGFNTPANANGFVALAHWVPAAGDPTDGAWRATVKYGRVGLAPTNPFKRPLVQIEPGACFRTPQPRPWYGRMVADVAPGDGRVVQYGLCYAVPACLPA